VTHLPCISCAKRLINLGNVEKIVFRNSYRKTESIDVLKSVGIEVYQFPPQG
jgi:deoxycytidylate deaminase